MDYYIYTLSIKGSVFYVGCSKDPITRYKTHYHDCLSKCYDLSRYWLSVKNIAMEMTLIDRFNNKNDALIAERKYITKYNTFHPLLNNQHFPYLYTTAMQRIDVLKTGELTKDAINHIKEQITKYGK